MALRRALLFLLLVLPLSSGFAADPPPIAPRPVSESERAAVDFLLRYLERDSDAVWKAVEPGSPLHAMGRDAAMREIEARLGPPVGSEWELRTVVPSLADRFAVLGVTYPSGIDDTIVVRLSQPTGKIDRIWVMAEPSPFAEPAPSKTRYPSASPRYEDPRGSRFLIGLAGVFAALCVPALRLYSRRIAASVLIVAVATFAGAFAWHAVRSRPPVKDVKVAEVMSEKPMLRMGELAPMRRMLATSNSGDLSVAFQQLPKGELRELARIWLAQADLNAMRSDETEAVLAQFERGTAVPLVEVLRARLALARSRESEAGVAYERASALGPGHDGVWGEASSAFWRSGFTDSARRYVDRMLRIGSRDASVYYVLAQLSVVDGKKDLAPAYFREGWQLHPVERAAVLSDGLLWTVLHEQTLYPLLALHQASEPAIQPRAPAVSPLITASTTSASTSGDHLLLRTEDAVLRVPMGCAIAPVGARALPPDVLERDEELRASRDLATLMSAAASTAALTQPVLRRKIEAAANHLARMNDWAGVAKITEPFAAGDPSVSADLLILRAAALRRLRREADASAVLAKVVTSPVIQRRSDPGMLAILAEMAASLDSFDAAIRLYQRADAKNELAYVDDRIRQLSAQKRLHKSYQSFATEHFDIRYSPGYTVSGRPQKIGEILEAEFKRLRKWIPVPGEFRKVEVQVLPWEEFRANFAFAESMAGLYDGRIRVPLADIPYLPAEGVAILSHELAHAMIAQATDDRAPNWFHEGLAQRVEMLPYRANSGAIYDDSRYLATSSVDGVLRGYPDMQLVEQAYLESHAIMQYIDARCGTKGIHRMLATYRRGGDTAAAVGDACGRTLDIFDREFLRWSRTDAPPVWEAAVISYDADFTAGIRRNSSDADSGEHKKREIPESLRRGAFNPKRGEKQ